MRWMAIAVLTAAPVCAGTAVDEAAKRFDAAVDKADGVGLQLRTLAAKALAARHPELAARYAPRYGAYRGKWPYFFEPSSMGHVITEELRQIRGLPTDADRRRAVVEVADEIRDLRAGAERLSLARSLCSLVTEGDLGTEALTAAAGALAEGINHGPPDPNAYVELASLVRYEHVAPPMQDPALDAALALLELREALHQEAGFTLTSLDGKTYSLDGLRGKVVLLNFWATWCPPCRKEMPDLQKMYAELAGKGFVVLAVSDEKRDVVEKFLADKHYTFPVLLDEGRKVNAAFDVEGIPKSFLFGRDGKIVGQAIDMRTERQFREMLKAAGL